MFSVEKKLHADGRVTHAALVSDGRFSVPHYCHCHPSDGHDHEATYELIRQGLAECDMRHDVLQGLVGSVQRVGLVTVTITDCHVKFLGPMLWRLVVGWDEKPVTHDAVHRQMTFDMKTPRKCPSPDIIMAGVRKRAEGSGYRLAAGLKELSR